MDQLWACDDMHEVVNFIEGLDLPQDRRDAQSLVWMAQVDTLEEEGGLDAHKGTYKRFIRSIGG